MSLVLYCLVHVLFHELKHEGKSTSWLVAAHCIRSPYVLEYFDEFDNMRMGCEFSKGLNFPHICDLVDIFVCVLHALDRNHFLGLDGLCFEHFREGAFALLANETIFYKVI